MGVGRGEHTAKKHAHLEGIVRWHAIASSGTCARHGLPYWYLDLNAGPGRISAEPDYIGSPLRVLPIVLARIPAAHSLLCEIERVSADRLLLEVRAMESRGEIPSGQVAVRCGDHHDLIPMWADERRRGTRGLAFHDPNGIPSFGLLETMARHPALERLDLLIYLTATGLKREYRRRAKYVGEDVSLADHLAAIDKRYWLVREPEGRHQWTFLLGSNWDNWKDWRNGRFYRSDSSHGRLILDRLTMTTRQRERRGNLGQLTLGFTDDD